MSWKRIKNPNEILNMGDEVKVKVLKIDREHARVSLGLKQLGGDPWQDISERYPVSNKVKGKVTNITDYGAFIEIEEGIEGLVHVSEMDWTNRNVNPSKTIHLGQEVEVMILDVDAERHRISLGIKQCTMNPWAIFAETHEKGQTITGKIKSITDFGIFIELPGGIDGLVYLSDIAWNESNALEVLRQYQKGDELQALILSIDVERERIALGLKQLAEDPITHYLNEHAKNDIVQGKVTTVRDGEALLGLTESVQGIIRSNDIEKACQAGDNLDVKILGVDKKTHLVLLTLPTSETNASDLKTTSKKAVSSSRSQPTQDKKKKAKSLLKTTLGDILKGHIKKE